MPQVLDTGTYWIDDRWQRHQFHGGIGLLDGRGGKLPVGFDPVILEWSRMALDAGLAKNSNGEPFTTLVPHG